MSKSHRDPERDRAGTFIAKGGRLYYSTESGLVFYISLKQLADVLENDEPMPVTEVVGIPSEATVYTTAQDGPEARAVLAWVDAIDHRLEALAGALREFMPEPKLPELRVVAVEPAA